MPHLFHQILDWSEVWAVMIPIIAFLFYRPKHYWRKPIVLYIFIALILNLAIDLIWFANSISERNIDNGIFYNIHCIIRFILFAWFFKLVGRGGVIDNIIVAIFLISAALIFIFEPFNKFNSPLLALEAAILLFYCIRYFYQTLKDDKPEGAFVNPVFIIVAGLCLYMAINFFIFMFYNYLTLTYRDYAIKVWDVHNISYIIFCIFIARAFKNEH